MVFSLLERHIMWSFLVTRLTQVDLLPITRIYGRWYRGETYLPESSFLDYILASCVLPITSLFENFSMECPMCGHDEDLDVHAVLECPLAIHIWKGYGFDHYLVLPGSEHLGIAWTRPTMHWIVRRWKILLLSCGNVGTLGTVLSFKSRIKTWRSWGQELLHLWRASRRPEKRRCPVQKWLTLGFGSSLRQNLILMEGVWVTKFGARVCVSKTVTPYWLQRNWLWICRCLCEGG